MMQTTKNIVLSCWRTLTKFWKRYEFEEEPPIDDRMQPIETFVEFESAPDFKGFEALRNTILDIDNQLLHSDIQTEVE